jgi:hypothetical protein
MHDTVQDAVGQGRVADLLVPFRYRQLRGQNHRSRLRAILADIPGGLGFTVVQGNNVTLHQLSRLVDEFAGRLQSGDLAVFYYSGHGMQVDRENYLLPVDFEAAAEADVPYTAYSASRIRDKMERSGARLRVLILDACRDNPYKSSRGGASGLAPMGATAEGTLIAFATGDNNTASDNPGQRNVFSRSTCSLVFGSPAWNRTTCSSG